MKNFEKSCTSTTLNVQNRQVFCAKQKEASPKRGRYSSLYLFFCPTVVPVPDRSLETLKGFLYAGHQELRERPDDGAGHETRHEQDRQVPGELEGPRDDGRGDHQIGRASCRERV